MVRALWTRMALSGLRTVNLEGLSGGRRPDSAMSDGAAEAMLHYGELMTALGPLGPPVYWVVIAEYSARDWGLAEGYGRTDGMGVLRLALDAAASYFRLPARNG